MARFSLAKATELDPGFMEAHNMQRARDRVPSSRLAIAEMSVKRGDVERAKEELRAYLKAAKPEDRQTAVTWPWSCSSR